MKRGVAKGGSVRRGERVKQKRRQAVTRYCKREREKERNTYVSIKPSTYHPMCVYQVNNGLGVLPIRRCKHDDFIVFAHLRGETERCR